MLLVSYWSCVSWVGSDSHSAENIKSAFRALFWSSFTFSIPFQTWSEVSSSWNYFAFLLVSLFYIINAVSLPTNRSVSSGDWSEESGWVRGKGKTTKKRCGLLYKNNFLRQSQIPLLYQFSTFRTWEFIIAFFKKVLESEHVLLFRSCAFVS